MYNYTPQATHHAKFDFDPMTWVVWANSQFATVSGVLLPSFLPSFLFFVFFGSAIYAHSRWWTAAILEIALFLYLSRELSDFDQIWYTDTNFHSEHVNLTKNRNFSNSGWRTDAILKTVFGVYVILELMLSSVFQ